MKVVFTGITGLRNRGVEAILVPSLEQLRERAPQLRATVLTSSPEFDALRLSGFEPCLLRDELRRFSGSRLRGVLLKTSRLYEPLMKSYARAARAVREADVVLASGGDVFASDYGHRSLQAHLRPLNLALEAGVPVVFMAQSIGPFKQPRDAAAWLRTGRRAARVIVREPMSRAYLVEELGLSPQLVEQTADPAFLLQPPPRETVAHMQRLYGIDAKRPIVALGISQAIARYSGTDYERHAEAWRAVIELVTGELGAQAVLVPHVQETNIFNDDRALASRLLRELDYPPDVRLIGADHTASELKGLIAACDLVVAERMHCCIAGLSSGIATLAVGYSVKAEGILTDLLGRADLERGVLIPVQEFLDSERARAAVRTAWERRTEIAERLRESLPRVKAQSRRTFDLVLDVARKRQAVSNAGTPPR